MFAERSLTIGKGKFGAGLNWLHSTYDTLAGRDLESGELRTVQNLGGDPLSFVTMKLDLSSDTVVAFASYGLTDEAEVAVAVPWVRIALGADINAFELSLPTGDLRLPRTATSGLGDIALVGKYRFWRQKDGGLAAGLELRLPTGDTNELRGLGVTRTLVSAIWSRGGTVSPHANIGYEIWSNDVPIAPGRGVTARHQWRYACGIEFTPHPRLTAVVDLVGRRLLGGGAIGFRTFADPLFGSADVLVGLPHGFDVVSLAPGVKWNVAGNALLTVNILASVTNDGLRADDVPVIGLDWAF
jgi:hypothetical protein